MDERLKAALEEGAKNGAAEVFENHEEYIRLIEEENARHEYEMATLAKTYEVNEAQYAFAQSILNGIINKLDKKD